MNATTFLFHEDPGHGWLEVPLSFLFELNIQNKITPYSYKGDNKVYLEEDCDMSTFHSAYKTKYGICPEIDIVYYNDDCFIRSLRHF